MYVLWYAQSLVCEPFFCSFPDSLSCIREKFFSTMAVFSTPERMKHGDHALQATGQDPVFKKRRKRGRKEEERRKKEQEGRGRKKGKEDKREGAWSTVCYTWLTWTGTSALPLTSVRPSGSYCHIPACFFIKCGFELPHEVVGVRVTDAHRAPDQYVTVAIVFPQRVSEAPSPPSQWWTYFFLAGNSTRYDLTPVTAVSVLLLSSNGTPVLVDGPIYVTVPLATQSSLRHNAYVAAWRFDQKLGKLESLSVPSGVDIFLVCFFCCGCFGFGFGFWFVLFCFWF